MPSQPDAPLDYLPRLPKRRNWRIGCVGAGFIMRDCHLVAYRQAGFNPVAIAARDPAKVKPVADQFAIPTVHQTVGELLSDPQIEVLDIAVPPATQPGVIHEAAKQGDHVRAILAQKPLAMNPAEARECVELCERAGILL